jgi:hypothetical protein
VEAPPAVEMPLTAKAIIDKTPHRRRAGAPSAPIVLE